MAKYKIIPSSRTIVQSPISIGHKAEKGVEAIEFDLTAWVETYGSGTLTVIMRRWGDAIPYPITLEIDENNKATWTLSDIDTAKAGMAYAQLSYIVGDTVVKKSDIYTFRVMDSLTGEGEPPEAYESWLEHLTHFAAEAMAEVLDIEGIVTDKTLTVDGGVADAKATGDALSALEDQFTEETDKLKADLDNLIERSNNLLDANNADVVKLINTNKITNPNNNARSVVIPITVTTQTKITATKTVASSRFAIATFTDYPVVNGTSVSVKSNNSATSLTIAVDSTIHYVMIYFWLESADTTVTPQEVLDGMMVEFGDTFTRYEPYYVSALTGEVTALTGEVTALTGEVTALTGEVVFPPAFEIDLSDYSSVKIYGTAVFYTYSIEYNRRAIQLADVPNTIEEASWDAVNSVLTINMPEESILLLDPIANTFTLQKNNWKVPTGKKVLLYRYYASYGGLLFDTSFTRRFNNKVQEIIEQNLFGITQQYAEQIGHVVGAADYYRSSTFTKDFTMLMISDTHSDNEEISRAIDVCNNVAAIDCLFHLGDIGGQRTAAQITTGKNNAVPYIQNANPQKPFFFAMGNHDEQNDATSVGGGTVEYGVSTIIPYLNTASIYNNRGYGYYDFATYKIRMIILNSFDYPDTASDNQFVFYEDYICWQEAQANFFVSTLSSTPADYTVIVCSHWCELGNIDNTKINQHWGATKQTLNNRTTVGEKTYMSDTVMSDIINAYKNRTSLSKSYSYTKGVTSVSYTITADFTNANGTFAIWLAGHRHLSGVANSAVGNYLIYVNDTSSCELPTNEWAAAYSNMPRSRGNNTRDLMT